MTHFLIIRLIQLDVCILFYTHQGQNVHGYYNYHLALPNYILLLKIIVYIA